MGSIDAMKKGSDDRYFGTTSSIKVAWWLVFARVHQGITTSERLESVSIVGAHLTFHVFCKGEHMTNYRQIMAFGSVGEDGAVG